MYGSHFETLQISIARKIDLSLVISWNMKTEYEKKRKKKNNSISMLRFRSNRQSSFQSTFSSSFFFPPFFILYWNKWKARSRVRNLDREKSSFVPFDGFHPPLFPLIWIAHIQHRTRSDAESEDRERRGFDENYLGRKEVPFEG